MIVILWLSKGLGEQSWLTEHNRDMHEEVYQVHQVTLAAQDRASCHDRNREKLQEISPTFYSLVSTLFSSVGIEKGENYFTS